MHFPSLRYILHVTILCGLFVVGAFVVGCDSVGSSSGGSTDDTIDDIEQLGSKTTVEVGSSSKALGTKAGGGVVTVTFFYETDSNDPCPAAASASVTPPDTTTLSPTKPACATGPKRGLNVSYVSLTSSEDGSSGVTLTVKNEGGDTVASASTEDGEVTIEGGEVPTEEDTDGSASFDWIGTWENVSGNAAFRLTETSVNTVEEGSEGICDTESFPIVSRSDTTITAVEDSSTVQYGVNVSSNTLTVTPPDGEAIEAEARDGDPLDFVDCSIGDEDDTGDENEAPQIESITFNPDTSNVFVGTATTLSAGASDPDGDDAGLSYTWSLESPSGSNASFSATNGPETIFTPDVAGGYTIVLTVSDGTDTTERRISLQVSSEDGGDGTTAEWTGVWQTRAYDGSAVSSSQMQVITESEWTTITLRDGQCNSITDEIIARDGNEITTERVQNGEVQRRVTFEMNVTDGTLQATVVKVEETSDFPDITMSAVDAAPDEALGCPGTSAESIDEWTGNWEVDAFDEQEPSSVSAYKITQYTWWGVINTDGQCSTFSDPIVAQDGNRITTLHDDGVRPTYDMSVSDSTLTATVVNVDGGDAANYPDITMSGIDSGPETATGCK